MTRLLPYLLLALLLFAAWDESLKERFFRTIGKTEDTTASAHAPVAAPTPKKPFWQNPSYRSSSSLEDKPKDGKKAH